MRAFVKWSSAILSATLIAVFALLSVRGIVDPGSGAQSFGVPAEDPASTLYHAVYRSRNLAIALTGLVFLVSGMWRALAITMTVAITLPLFDIYALTAAGARVAPVHPATLAALVLVAGLLWLRLSQSTNRS